MEKQITFDDLRNNDRMPPTRHDVDTSKASAKEVAKAGLGTKLKAKIYQLIKVRGRDGATCDEVEVSLEVKHQSASCLIRFLTQDGFLYDSHERRLTRSGRKAIVWQAI